MILEKASSISGGIFNYPGLRIETRSIGIEDIKNNYPRIACFGDSVTFGWNLKYEDCYPFLLEDLLSKNGYPTVKVINCGVGGDTVVDGYQRIEKDIFYFEPDLVILNFGLNDGMLWEIERNNFEERKSLIYEHGKNYYVPRVDLKVFYQYYIRMIDEINSRGIKVVILGLNPVLHTFPLSMDESLREKQREVYAMYNNKILEIARDKKIVCVDLWNIFLEKKDLKNYIQGDGIHPTGEGQSLIARSVFLVLKQSDIISRSR
ncbi:MAG: hypothetical protein H5T85_01935 [Actinobacteria bacterium]|nr:hypothetical protein [Actinomycetota bacterium]